MLCALLLLLPGLLAVVTAAPDCSGGPDAWCLDLGAATACGALSHCRDTLWARPPADSMPCRVCLDVAAARPHSDPGPLVLLGRACEWLQGPGEADRCRELVSGQPSELRALLASGPGPACAALTLCRLPAPAPAPASSTPTPAPTPAAPPTVCQACVGLLGRLQAAAGDRLPALATALTEEQCGALGAGLGGLCRAYIRRLLSPSGRVLGLATPTQLCAHGGFCEAALRLGTPAATAVATEPGRELAPRRRAETEPRMEDGRWCEMCMDAMERVDHWLENNRTEQLILSVLDRMCTIMPGGMKEHCVQMVDTYGPSMLDMLSRVAPERVCHVMRMCGAPERRARSLRRAPRPSPPPPPAPEPWEHGSFCSGCKRLLATSTRDLGTKTTRHDLLRALRTGCRLLPLPYLVQCDRFVGTYHPVLVETLQDAMDPPALCWRLGACHPARQTLRHPEQCAEGPRLWCRSRDLAELCDAVEHCQRHVWGQAEASRSQ